MYRYKRLFQAFNTAEQIPFDDSSRFILLSDCHRGDGSWADDFSKNQNIYIAALSYYFDKNYTYIELGDGDELWENRRLADIMREHKDAFWLINRFIRAGRFYSLYGNHDYEKKDYGFKSRKDFQLIGTQRVEFLRSFEEITFHEGLVLLHKPTGYKIFLVHGHQVDFLNDQLKWISRFLVRYIWRPLEFLGVNDPTSPAKNHKRKALVERKLMEWVRRENQMLIAGHTHRSVFPNAGELPYFNDGSCVHPRCITGIEIADGTISLVKWSIKTKNDGTLFIGRDILEGPGRLTDYMNWKEIKKN